MRSLRRSPTTWFTTPRGREVAFYGVCTVAVGTTLGHLLPHTFLLDKYQEFIQMYQLGLPATVHEKFKGLMENVMNDMGVSERERKFIKSFTAYGFDIFHAGSTSTKFGALIGIPSTFAYDSTEDVDKHNITVNHKQINWNTDRAKMFEQSLVLSDDARKFAIGREISCVQTSRVFLNSIYPASVIAFVYGFSRSTNDKFGLLKKHISVRLVFYSLIGLFAIGTWCFLKDFTTVQYELQADKEMCKLGEHYIKGGLEFYSKLLLRNKALRELMGDEGEKMYAVTGNQLYMLRRKHVPLTLRKEYLQNCLTELRTPAQQPEMQDASIPAPA